MENKSFYRLSLRLVSNCFMAASNPYFLAVRKDKGSLLFCKGENLAMCGEGVFAEGILSPIFLILELGVEN